MRWFCAAYASTHVRSVVSFSCASFLRPYLDMKKSFKKSGRLSCGVPAASSFASAMTFFS